MAEDIVQILWEFPAIDPRTAIIAVDPGAYCIIPDETRATAAREIERLRAALEIIAEGSADKLKVLQARAALDNIGPSTHEQKLDGKK